MNGEGPAIFPPEPWARNDFEVNVRPRDWLTPSRLAQNLAGRRKQGRFMQNEPQAHFQKREDQSL